jgi:hypothetical protein
MRIDMAGARQSTDQLMATLDSVSQRLADGRKYLMRDRFGAAGHHLCIAACACRISAWPAGATTVRHQKPGGY